MPNQPGPLICESVALTVHAAGSGTPSSHALPLRAVPSTRKRTQYDSS